MEEIKQSLGDRMKSYERKYRNFLDRKIPAIIRLDGKSFHTFTKGLQKPFDNTLVNTMQKTMQYLCENIQGCVFGYTQSDEITLILTDYATPTTDSWFGYNIQKMTSVSASMATLAFNKFWGDQIECLLSQGLSFGDCYDAEILKSEKTLMERIAIIKEKSMCATFDSRVFSLPKNEVINCLIWRQQDAIRNSIEAMGQAYFSPKQLHRKNCDMIKKMLREEKEIDWYALPIYLQRGSCCTKVQKEFDMVSPHTGETVHVVRNDWVPDVHIPLFQNKREFVTQYL